MPTALFVNRMSLIAIVAALTAFAHSTDAGDWPAWRGPNQNGVAASDQQPPVEWSKSKNIVWSTPVPGRGHSSPTIVGDRIFLATADESNQVQGIIAFDRADGKQAWITKLSQGGFPKTHAKNTHASGTIACDGERLYVTFHHDNKLTLHAVSLDGKEVWSKDVGAYRPQKYEYGYAASPLLYKDSVIVAGDVDQGGYIVAYDAATGRRLWNQQRPAQYSFSSPVVTNVAGKDQLLISGCELVASYDPSSGKPLWSVKGTTNATCGTMVWDGDIVFASGGYPDAETIAVQADGSGNVVWRNRQKCYEQSMLAHDGYVYAFTDQGVVHCWRAQDGEEMWKQRLGGPVSASPVLAGGNIYATNEKGVTWVFRATPDGYQQVAQNELGNEGFATMSIVDDRIYLRTAEGWNANRKETLYCIGEK